MLCKGLLYTSILLLMLTTAQPAPMHMESHINSTLCKDVIFQNELPRNCLDILCLGSTENGIYTIHPTRKPEYFMQVFCDQVTDGGGWLVFQRRMDGSVDFQRNWKNYQLGFGELNGEFWLGNDNLAVLTKPQSEIEGTELRVDLEYSQFTYSPEFAQYSSFAVGNRSTNYVLTVGEFSGGDEDFMGWFDGNKFSTFDKDNERTATSICVDRFTNGGWWYGGCIRISLHGSYQDGKGISWGYWRGQFYPLKFTEMKLRPNMNTNSTL